MTLSDAKKRSLSINMILYDYSLWSENNGELIDKEVSTNIPPIPPLKIDEEKVKEGKGLKKKKKPSNKLLTKLPILLAQIKTGNSSNKSKNEIRLILYLFYQHNKTTKNVYNYLLKSL